MAPFFTDQNNDTNNQHMGETMGLDMYAYVTDEKPTKEVDFPEPETYEELHYWRKHPNLHGWMQRLYVRKGGGDENFNNVPVVLTRDDLEELETALVKNRLPVTVGFFFGHSTRMRLDDDLIFVAEARAAIDEGKTVIYIGDW